MSMLETILDAAEKARRTERAHNSTLLSTITEQVLTELARYDYKLPTDAKLPHVGPYNSEDGDLISLWYDTKKELRCKYYYPTRGTGDDTWQGLLRNANSTIQIRTFKLLFQKWVALQGEMDHRLRNAHARAAGDVRADQEARVRDGDLN